MARPESQTDERLDTVREDGQPERLNAPSGIRTAVSALIFATILEAGCHVRYWYSNPAGFNENTAYNQQYNGKMEEKVLEREKEKAKDLLEFSLKIDELKNLLNSKRLNKKKLFLLMFRTGLLEISIRYSYLSEETKKQLLIKTGELIKRALKEIKKP